MSETAVKTEKKTKGKRGKTVLKVLGIIVGLLLVVIAVGALVSFVGSKSNIRLAKSFAAVEYEDQLIPKQDKNGNWCFTTDEDFHVMQLTDVHIGGGWMSISKDTASLTAVETMVRAEKPDLVIVTGDVAYPVPFQAGTLNNKTGAHEFAELMETLGVYWTIGFGNHDTEAYSYYSREDIAAFYTNGSYPHCLFVPGPENISGSGNQVIKVKNTYGVITQAFFVIDSHSYTDGDYFGIQWKYDNIHEDQIEWYRACIEEMNEENRIAVSLIENKTVSDKMLPLVQVKSMAFFHIPLPEYRDAWNEFAENGYKDTENVKYYRGIIGETGKAIFCGIHEDDVFETFQELGSTKAIFCGHDHFNSLSLNYKGIDLTYGYSIDNLAYIGINKKGSQRGCTMITVHPDGTYEINMYNLYTSGRYEMPSEFTKDIVMQFEDVTYQYFEEK